MPVNSDPQRVSIANSADVVMARQMVRNRAITLGFGLVDQTKVVTAASELARNTLEHGGGGSMTIESLEKTGKPGIRLVFEDSGPGISDINLALTEGYSTGSGMGLGLSGSKRLMSEFEIASVVGQGTRITVVKWK